MRTVKLGPTMAAFAIVVVGALLLTAVVMTRAAQAATVTYRLGGFTANHWYVDRDFTSLKGGSGQDGVDDWGEIYIRQERQNGSWYASTNGGGGISPVVISHPSIAGHTQCKDDFPTNLTGGFNLTCKRVL